MRNFFRLLILIIIAIPTLVFADGIELEYIEPSYNTNQLTYINNVEKPLVFDFTFTPESKDMVYRLKLTNTTTKALYITEIDHSVDDNIIISYDGIKKTDIMQPGEARNVTIKFEMKNYPTTEYSNQVSFYFKYDLAENHVQTTDSLNPGRRGNNSILENPATGVLNVVVIVVPFIIVLSAAYLLINKKDKTFKTFIILLVPIAASLVISNVTAEKTEGTVVISGNVKFEKLSPTDGRTQGTIDPDGPTDPKPRGNEDYDVFLVEIDPNGGTFNNSPNVFKANYRKGSLIDLSSIDRLYYRFINWTYVDDDKTFDGNELFVLKNAKLKANWEYGPYYWVTIDPNGGVYKESTKPFKTKLKEGESLDVERVTREGYAFYKWEENSNTSSFQDNKIKMNKRDVSIKARWEGIYTLTFDKNADEALCGMVSKEVTNMFEIGPLPTPTRDGYDFAGWYIDDNKIEPTTIFTKDQDATAVAHWKARSDTKYTINHWKQKPRTNPDLKPDSYSLEKKEILEGVTDTEVEPDVLNIEGYDSPDKVKITILGNGNRVVDYYYLVKRYEILVSVNEGIKEIRYKINGSDEYRSTTSTTTLKAEYNTNYSLYAISKEGWYYNETSESHPRTGIVSIENTPFSPNASKCPAGYSCDSGSDEPEKCPAGTYAIAESGECSACPAGTHASSAGSDHCDVCPAGTKCGNGSKDPEVCPAGTYAVEGSSECSACPAGTHASSAGSDHCDTCPAGTKCSGGSKDPEVCPTGTFAEKPGSSKCVSCSEGTYASLPGSTACTTCPKGSKCSSVDPTNPDKPGPSGPEVCPAGTYSNEGSSECTSCPTGTYSSNAGSDHCDTCPAGTKCSGGSDKPTSCPAGTYAEVGSGKCTSCSEGTYASLPGSTSCTTCPKGSKCSKLDPTDPDKPGPVKPEVCPAGTYAEEGSGECTSCPAGTHASNAGSDRCDTCPVGTECSGGTEDPKPCSPGSYSSDPGTSTCNKCPAGTYTSTSGSTSCDRCPEGHKCETGSEKPTKCSAGTYAAAGSSECAKCPRNTYSEAGATSCLSCDTGWESDEGASACRRKSFNVSFTPYDTNARLYATVRDNPLGVPYGSYNTTIITPTYGYYISDIVCTNSFTSDHDSSYLNNNASVNYSTVRIYNPGKEMGSTCTYYVTRITASMVTYNSTYSTCTDTQCALDDLYNKMRGLGL